MRDVMRTWEWETCSESSSELCLSLPAHLSIVRSVNTDKTPQSAHHTIAIRFTLHRVPLKPQDEVSAHKKTVTL